MPNRQPVKVSTTAKKIAPAVLPVKKGRGKPARATSVNKSELIRSLPSSMTASEVVAEAKRRGVKIPFQLVYVVRAKQASGKPTRKPGRPRKHPLPDAAPVEKKKKKPKTHAPPAAPPKRREKQAKSSKLPDIERLLAEVIVMIGLPRTETLIGNLRKALD